MSAPLFDRLCLIGAGLIGSSIAHAVRRDGGLAGEVVVYSRSAQTRDQVRALGFADQVEDDLMAAIDDADCVILCTPMGSFEALGTQIAPLMKAGAIVTDVGSVKEIVLKQLGPILPKGVHLIPGHPIAGTENSGPGAGFATLFDGKWSILTPPADADAAAVATMQTFWQRLGAKVEVMSAAHHDIALAVTSHLPHLIAFNIVGTAKDLEGVTEAEVIKYSAGGFRDFTRIAASDPTMWRDVFLTNREAVLEVLGRFTEDLSALQKAIRNGDGDALFDLFTRTRAIRKGIVDAEQAEEPQDN